MHRPAPFTFVGERLWLDFVNTDDGERGSRGHADAHGDALSDFATFVRWLELAGTVDPARAAVLRRRAHEQPAGASAALADARRLRDALRALAERGVSTPVARLGALAELNRVLGRTAGTRRIEMRDDGTFARSFVGAGDAFAGLIVPVVESAADALVGGELTRVRACANPRCSRVFHDETRNGSRRWCEMATCGNRAKAARFRSRRGGGEPQPDLAVRLEPVPYADGPAHVPHLDRVAE